MSKTQEIPVFNENDELLSFTTQKRAKELLESGKAAPIGLTEPRLKAIIAEKMKEYEKKIYGGVNVIRVFSNTDRAKESKLKFNGVAKSKKNLNEPVVELPIISIEENASKEMHGLIKVLDDTPLRLFIKEADIKKSSTLMEEIKGKIHERNLLNHTEGKRRAGVFCVSYLKKADREQSSGPSLWQNSATSDEALTYKKNAEDVIAKIQDLEEYKAQNANQLKNMNSILANATSKIILKENEYFSDYAINPIWYPGITNKEIANIVNKSIYLIVGKSNNDPFFYEAEKEIIAMLIANYRKNEDYITITDFAQWVNECQLNKCFESIKTSIGEKAFAIIEKSLLLGLRTLSMSCKHALLCPPKSIYKDFAYDVVVNKIMLQYELKEKHPDPIAWGAQHLLLTSFESQLESRFKDRYHDFPFIIIHHGQPYMQGMFNIGNHSFQNRAHYIISFLRGEFPKLNSLNNPSLNIGTIFYDHDEKKIDYYTEVNEPNTMLSFARSN